MPGFFYVRDLSLRRGDGLLDREQMGTVCQDTRRECPLLGMRLFSVRGLDVNVGTPYSLIRQAQRRGNNIVLRGLANRAQ
jgi:hypothetical protein